ncbi:Hypothetical predicted protein [Olea europaea subsp. europaea]|uniref:Uncharacterized protein n=1 Tax=Olea europaea subsp. europaea TaxID=158383 RepID=A0A8S0SEG4_OLEEU|nr:Hypothetical predicted protein [Olea europaea subsp. europaea]
MGASRFSQSQDGQSWPNAAVRSLLPRLIGMLTHNCAELLHRLVLPPLYRRLASWHLLRRNLQESIRANPTLALLVRIIDWELYNLYSKNEPEDPLSVAFSPSASRAMLEDQLAILARCRQLESLSMSCKALLAEEIPSPGEDLVPFLPGARMLYPWPTTSDLGRLPFLDCLRSFSLRIHQDELEDEIYDHQAMYPVFRYFLQSKSITSLSFGAGKYCRNQSMFGCFNSLPLITRLSITVKSALDLRFIFGKMPNLDDAKITYGRVEVNLRSDLSQHSSLNLLSSQLTRLRVCGTFPTVPAYHTPSLAILLPALQHLYLDIAVFTFTHLPVLTLSAILDYALSTGTPFMNLRTLIIASTSWTYFMLCSREFPCSLLSCQLPLTRMFPNLRLVIWKFQHFQIEQPLDPNELQWQNNGVDLTVLTDAKRYWQSDFVKILQTAKPHLCVQQKFRCRDPTGLYVGTYELHGYGGGELEEHWQPA